MNSIVVNSSIFICAVVINSIVLSITSIVSKQALTAFIVVQTILANLLITKQIVLFGFLATSTDALAISTTLSYNMMQELYGLSAAREALKAALICVIFYLISLYIQILYIPALCDTAHVHFSAIFCSQSRIVAASVGTYYVIQYLDIIFYGILKNFFADRFFVLRNYCSVLISHFADTVLFTYAGLYGLVGSVWQIILISYSIKVCATVLQTPCLWLVRKLYDRSKNIF